MGTIYYVGCRDCNVFRDLDKFQAMSSGVDTREKAIEYATKIKKDSFRCGLLVSFLADHMGHSCVVFTDRNELIWGEFIDEGAKQESDEFWSIGPQPPIP